MDEGESYEANYARVGWRTGPFASPEIRISVRRFWASRGKRGAAWLARRLRSEIQVYALEGAANLLADVGAEAIGPILAELDAGPTPDQAEALRKALIWIEGGDVGD